MERMGWVVGMMNEEDEDEDGSDCELDFCSRAIHLM